SLYQAHIVAQRRRRAHQHLRIGSSRRGYPFRGIDPYNGHGNSRLPVLVMRVPHSAGYAALTTAASKRRRSNMTVNATIDRSSTRASRATDATPIVFVV